MNLTPYLKRTGMTADAAIQQMREEVKHETGLTVSAGCGANTMLAKVAADFNKPDGHYIVSGLLPVNRIVEMTVCSFLMHKQVEPSKEGCKAFMDDLSVRKIPGVSFRFSDSFGCIANAHGIDWPCHRTLA